MTLLIKTSLESQKVSFYRLQSFKVCSYTYQKFQPIYDYRVSYDSLRVAQLSFGLLTETLLTPSWVFYAL